MNPQRVQLGAFVDRDQHRELSELARREDRSVSSIVRRAIAGYIERENPAARARLDTDSHQREEG